MMIKACMYHDENDTIDATYHRWQENVHSVYCNRGQLTYGHYWPLKVGMA